MPVAHHDGNYFADDETLNRLEGEGRVAFRYCAPDGELDETHNPNGSARNIAGIFNETKTVLGLMPHPEDATDPLLGSLDGVPFFDGLVEALAVTERARKVDAALVAEHGLTAEEYARAVEDPGPRAQPDRARHLLGDVVGALLLQILEELAEDSCRPRARG